MGRTTDIPVFCGNSCEIQHSDIAIPITRTASSSPSPSHYSKTSSGVTGKSPSPSVYEVPLTPAHRSKANAPYGDPLSRTDVMSARPSGYSSIYEIPPTPPGAQHGPKNNSRVREISVTSTRSPYHEQVHIELQKQADAENSSKAEQVEEQGVREDESHEQEEDDDDVPVDDIASKSHPARDIDFSLFLIRNARVREQIRESRKREPGKKASDQEENLEALLRKWEAAQLLEEEASVRPGEEDVVVRVISVPQPPVPSLKDLSLLNYINSDGKIEPCVEPNTAVSVFAVLDRLKKVQYIGVSKNLRNTMRKIMGRKPGFCYFYKVYNISDSELTPQPHLIKKRWFEELGTTPPGNGDKQWEQPFDVTGNLDGRTVLEAAIHKVKNLIQIMVDRGLKEEMVYDPALMDFGKCDVLEATTPAYAPKGKHTVIQTPYGRTIEFYICYNEKTETDRGSTYDVSVNKDKLETRHVISGVNAPATGNLTEDVYLELVMAYLLHKGIPRNKEPRTAFPMASFSIPDFLRKFEDFKIWSRECCSKA